MPNIFPLFLFFIYIMYLLDRCYALILADVIANHCLLVTDVKSQVCIMTDGMPFDIVLGVD